MRTYIPSWIDRYAYIITTSVLRQYPRILAELGKMSYMKSPDKHRMAVLTYKKDAVERVLSELDDCERQAISECFFRDTTILNADVPMSESSIKRLNKRVILRLAEELGEIKPKA